MTVSQARLILITGGSRGIGAATARLAAAHGYDVAISYITNDSAALAVAADIQSAGRRALAVRADSADAGQVEGLFAAIDRELGRIDVLVNNAAILACRGLFRDWDIHRRHWRKMTNHETCGVRKIAHSGDSTHVDVQGSGYVCRGGGTCPAREAR